jgi:hypothetical protein
MPKFIVALQSLETGELIEATIEAVDEPTATTLSGINYPESLYAWCYTTTSEQQYALDTWYATESLIWDEQCLCIN